MNPFQRPVTFLDRIALIKPRIVYRWRHRRDDKVREEALATIRHSLERADGNNLPNFRCIHNTSLYVLLVDQDLVTFSRDFFFANTKQRRYFVARHLAVLLYEVSQDVPGLIGGAYRAALRTIDLPDDRFQQLNEIAKEFDQFKKSHQGTLGTIRNMVAAHRDKDAALQIATLDGLDPFSVFRLAADYSSPLNKLIDFQIEVTRRTGNPRFIVRELASRSSEG